MMQQSHKKVKKQKVRKNSKIRKDGMMKMETHEPEE
jgi:hypothetical protein